MKKKNLKSFKLNKKSISTFNNIHGGMNAQTCQGPCQNGTTCCNWGSILCPEPAPIKISNGPFFCEIRSHHC